MVLAEKLRPSSSDNQDQKSLVIASFNPAIDVSHDIIIGGDVMLVNPTNSYFERYYLNLTVKIDDFELIAPDLAINGIGGLPTHKINIAPYENITISLLFGKYELSKFTYYFGDGQISAFSSHVIKFYVSQSKFGDIINDESFTIQQKKAYLQIVGYSSIEHSNDTWHEYFNSAKNQYEWRNDQPNYAQQYFNPAAPLPNGSYYAAKRFHQLKEDYFNVTVFNNNTFPVGSIYLYGGGGGMVGALSTIVLQPNETYVYPIPITLLGGDPTADTVYQLDSFHAEYAYATGDLID